MDKEGEGVIWYRTKESDKGKVDTVRGSEGLNEPACGTGKKVEVLSGSSMNVSEKGIGKEWRYIE